MNSIMTCLWATCVLFGPPSLGSPKVAVVNVPLAHEKYARTKDLEAEFEVHRRQFNETRESFRDRIERETLAIRDFKSGTPDYEERGKQIAQLQFEMQWFVESGQRKLDAQLAKALKLIFTDIKAEIRRLAEERGIDVVVAADESPDDPSPTSAGQKNQILLQKVLYWSPEVDLTDELIARLNDRYSKQGTNKPAQSAAEAKGNEPSTK